MGLSYAVWIGTIEGTTVEYYFMENLITGYSNFTWNGLGDPA